MATSPRTYNVLKIFQSALNVLWRKLWKRNMSSFSGTGRSMNIVAWKCWFLWNNEYFSGRKKGESLWEKLRWWGKPVGCCKLPFYANECCDEHARMHIVGDDWNDTPCSSLFGSLAMMQFLSNWGHWFSCIFHAYSINAETNRRIRYKK